jgi:hypothetical protein
MNFLQAAHGMREPREDTLSDAGHPLAYEDNRRPRRSGRERDQRHWGRQSRGLSETGVDQALVEFDPGHLQHVDVGDQARCFADTGDARKSAAEGKASTL